MGAKEMLDILYAGFVKCPNTGEVLEVLKGDDKVMCRCGKSNPRFPNENTEQRGTHYARFCEIATADDFLKQIMWKGEK